MFLKSFTHTPVSTPVFPVLAVMNENYVLLLESHLLALFTGSWTVRGIAGTTVESSPRVQRTCPLLLSQTERREL